MSAAAKRVAEEFKKMVKEKLGVVPPHIEAMCDNVPEVVAPFVRMYGAAMGPGALDPKTKELIGLALAVALGVPEEGMRIIADDSASEDRRTFTLRTREPNGAEHELTWDFLDPSKQEDILMIECKHFLECIERRERPRTDGWHAVEVMRRLSKISPDYKKG